MSPETRNNKKPVTIINFITLTKEEDEDHHHMANIQMLNTIPFLCRNI